MFEFDAAKHKTSPFAEPVRVKPDPCAYRLHSVTKIADRTIANNHKNLSAGLGAPVTHCVCPSLKNACMILDNKIHS
jgi:hypothetical protein